tara:strand:+ start:254 stop:472 length:219 start_codon:yes stop_codon:yes gene_type:complete
MDIKQARKIKSLLIENGITQVSIAEEEDVSASYVHQVIHRIKKGQRVREAIADALGKSVDELWPPEKSSKAT